MRTNAPFPLTPALSLRERENCRPSFGENGRRTGRMRGQVTRKAARPFTAMNLPRICWAAALKARLRNAWGEANAVSEAPGASPLESA